MNTSLHILRDDKIIVHVPLSNFPEGILRECYETDTEIIVLGDPIDETHNCDVMGCSSAFHIRYRYKKRKKQ
jgi:hypothetical protein